MQQYPYGGGPIADSVTVAGSVRIDAGRQLQVCSIAYFFDDSTPRSTCKNLSGGQVQSVSLTLRTRTEAVSVSRAFAHRFKQM